MEKNKKFKIKYNIILDGADSIKNKEIRIDNCMSPLHAQIRLGDYLKKKYINFNQLVVIECKDDYFDSAFTGFGDIFGSNNFNKIFGGK